MPSGVFANLAMVLYAGSCNLSYENGCGGKRIGVPFTHVGLRACPCTG